MQQLISDATSQYTESLQSSALRSQLRNLTTQLVQYRLDKHFFGGSCIRNHTTTCPKGWNENEGGVGCLPPADYAGPCLDANVEFSNFATPETKMEISRRCRVEWPCKACVLDFETCPLSWKADPNASGRMVCKTAGHYDGYCDHRVDFTNTTSRDKAAWAVRCQALWRCKT